MAGELGEVAPEEKEGYVEKRGGGTSFLGRKSWKRRWAAVKEGKLLFWPTADDALRGQSPIKERELPVSTYRLVGYRGEARLLPGQDPSSATAEVYPDGVAGTVNDIVLFSLSDMSSPLALKRKPSLKDLGDDSLGEPPEAGRGEIRIRMPNETEADEWLVALWRHGLDPGEFSHVEALVAARRKGYRRWNAFEGAADRTAPPPPITSAVAPKPPPRS